MAENYGNDFGGNGRAAWMLAIGSMVALILVLAPIAFYFYNFSTAQISKDPADWSSFGSYVAGTVGTVLAIASVAALIVTLRSTSSQHSRMYALTLRALEKSERQLQLMERQHGVEVFQGFLDELRTSIEKPVRVRNSDVSHDQFFADAYKRLSVSVWARMSNNNQEARRGFDLMLSGGILREMGVSFHAQRTKLWIVINFLDKCESLELRSECLRLARSKLNEDMMFWLCGDIYLEMREVFLRRNDLLFFPKRAARAIERGTESALAQGPPPNGQLEDF